MFYTNKKPVANVKPIQSIDNDRTYFGCIKRLRDAEGNQFVFSRIVMPDG
jgi:hypothetical protein